MAQEQKYLAIRSLAFSGVHVSVYKALVSGIYVLKQYMAYHGFVRGTSSNNNKNLTRGKVFCLYLDHQKSISFFLECSSSAWLILVESE